MIVDAGILLSAANTSDPSSEVCRGLLAEWPGALVVSAFVAAEADYLIQDRLGVDAQLSFLEDLASGAYTLDSLDWAGVGRAHEVCSRYRDLSLGLTDASIVVLADRWQTTDIASFDERHFRAVEPLAGGSFRLLPADA